MRTTLDLDEDVLEAVKELAASRGTTAGKVLSALARRVLEPRRQAGTIRNGVPVLPRGPAGSRLVTMELVNRFRDDPLPE